MKANELRCGNYVTVPRKEQSPFRVDYFDRVKVYQDNGTYECTPFGEIPMHPLTWDLVDIDGIVLTTEILEKCGGHISDNGVNWKNPEYEIWVFRGMLVGMLNGKFYLYNNCEDDFYSWYSPEITYLHQFQNLYYCLCSEELEVKL